MSHLSFPQHQDLPEKAVQAIHTRGYWSPFPEMPSGKAYRETANDDGKAAFQARLKKSFPLDEPGVTGQIGREISPYGLPFRLFDNDSVLNHANDAAAAAGIALSCNLTGGVYVNQSAAFSDFHGTGANPATNSALTDSAFVANRFRVVQSRVQV